MESSNITTREAGAQGADQAPDHHDRHRRGHRHRALHGQRHRHRLRRAGGIDQLRHRRADRGHHGVQPGRDGGGASVGRIVRHLRRDVPEPLGRLRGALHLLDHPGRGRGRRGGGGGAVHDLLVPRHAGMDVVGGVRPDPDLRELQIGGQLRLVRILVRADQGGRDHGLHRHRAGARVRHRHRPSAGRHAQPDGLEGGFMPHGLRCGWAC